MKEIKNASLGSIKKKEFVLALNELIGASSLRLDKDINVTDMYRDMTFDSLTDAMIARGVFEVKIKPEHAMSYLIYHDNDLRKSMEWADEMGYGVLDVDSALLASLLASHNALEDWLSKRNLIQFVITNLKW